MKLWTDPFTIPSVGCAQRGAYRVTASDGCRGVFTQEAGSEAVIGEAGCP
jgi:hypothetical protein